MKKAVSFLTVFSLCVGANVYPWWTTRFEPMADGFRLVGLPFTFFRRGGNMWREDFFLWAFILDLGLAIIISVVVSGYLTRVRSHS
jgi:hypothetical protein